MANEYSLLKEIIIICELLHEQHQDMNNKKYFQESTFIYRMFSLDLFLEIFYLVGISWDFVIYDETVQVIGYIS